MAKKKRRPANDRALKKYKTNNQREKNKIRKLERHCKRHPNDKEGKKNLERIKKEGISDKKPPRKHGINTDSVIGRNPMPGFIHYPQTQTCGITAGQQLSNLLGIPLRQGKRNKRRKRAKIHVKQKS